MGEHDWFGVCSWWLVRHDSDQFLLHFNEWLYVCLAVVGCSPDAEALDEVGEDLCIIELYHGLEWEELGSVSKGLGGWVEFLYGVDYGMAVFVVVLHHDPQQFCLCVVFECSVVDPKMENVRCGARVEDCVICFGWVWDQVIAVEVGDEVAEF